MSPNPDRIDHAAQRIAADVLASMTAEEVVDFVGRARAVPDPDPDTIATRQGLTQHIRDQLTGTTPRAGQAGIAHGGGTGLNENRLTSGLASLLGPNTTINGQDQ